MLKRSELSEFHAFNWTLRWWFKVVCVLGHKIMRLLNPRHFKWWFLPTVSGERRFFPRVFGWGWFLPTFAWKVNNIFSSVISGYWVMDLLAVLEIEAALARGLNFSRCLWVKYSKFNARLALKRAERFNWAFSVTFLRGGFLGSKSFCFCFFRYFSSDL